MNISRSHRLSHLLPYFLLEHYKVVVEITDQVLFFSIFTDSASSITLVGRPKGNLFAIDAPVKGSLPLEVQQRP